MDAPFSFLPQSLLQRGVLAGALAVLLTMALELTCLDEVHKLCVSNKALYHSAIRTNLWNNLVLGPLTYYVAIHYFCQLPGKLSVTEQVQAALGIVLVEAVLYYGIHRSFHEIKGLYWMHSYHHKFNVVILPSSANAVSVAEYNLAYMLPLVAGVLLTHADELSTFAGSAIVAIANLLIHTPWLDASTATTSTHQLIHRKTIPWLFVTASDHFNHHRPQSSNGNSSSSKNYGAPILHMDRIVERCASFHQTNPTTTTTSRCR